MKINWNVCKMYLVNSPKNNKQTLKHWTLICKISKIDSNDQKKKYKSRTEIYIYIVIKVKFPSLEQKTKNQSKKIFMKTQLKKKTDKKIKLRDFISRQNTKFLMIWNRTLLK